MSCDRSSQIKYAAAAAVGAASLWFLKRQFDSPSPLAGGDKTSAKSDEPNTSVSQIVFALNGEKVVINEADLDVTVSLNEYLRTQTKLRGTKLSCGEGGCGACAVVVAEFDSASGKVKHGTVNSCLVPLCSLDGRAIVTVEGLGSSANGKRVAHPVAQRIAGFNGSQCGFCTPGMVMTLYATLREHADTVAAETAVAGDESKEGSGAVSAPTMAQIERRFDGNICRCTGYRPILDAAKSFGCDTTVTDQVCKTTPVGAIALDPALEPAFPDFLKDYQAQRLSLTASNGARWLRPVSSSELTAILKAAAAAADGAAAPSLSLVVGNTGSGIYKAGANGDVSGSNGSGSAPSVSVDIRRVPELASVGVGAGCAALTVGACVPIAALMTQLQALAEKLPGNQVLPGVLRLLQRVANVHVRSNGSVGGNIVLAKTRGFLSDLVTALAAADATVTVTNHLDGSSSTQSLLSWVADAELPFGTVLTSITIPTGSDNQVLRTYKTAIRSVNSHSYINAGLYAQTDGQGTVTACRLVYGGVGRTATRLSTAEAALTGSALTPAVADAVLAAVASEAATAMAGTDGHGLSTEYRVHLVRSFTLKFLNSLSPSAAAAAPSADYTIAESNEVYPRPVSSASQAFSFSAVHDPVAQALPKLSAQKQATGEAVYSDDVLTPAGTQFARYVCAPSRGSFTVDASAALALPGVTAVLTEADIPGANEGSPFGGKEPILCASAPPYAGQPVALVVATSNAAAARGAFAVRVLPSEPASDDAAAVASFAALATGVDEGSTVQEWEAEEAALGFAAASAADAAAATATATAAAEEGEEKAEATAGAAVVDAGAAAATEAEGEGPVDTSETQTTAAAAAAEEEEVAPFEYVPSVPQVCPPLTYVRGDVVEAFKQADGEGEITLVGVVSSDSQKHFYMEPHCTTAIPWREGGGITIYSAMQYPSAVHNAVAGALGLPLALVRVCLTRAGGGFGGKLTRNVHVACAAAVAAMATGTPIRMALDRNTDMRTTGGRHEMVARYRARVDSSSGRVTALRITSRMSGGFSTDISGFARYSLARAVDQAYYFPHFSVRAEVQKTARPTRTAVRGPGEIQSSLVIETVMQHVAAAAALPLREVQAANTFPDDPELLFSTVPAGAPPLPLLHYSIPQLMSQLLSQAKVAEREQAVADFNASHSLVKRGLAVTRIKYEVGIKFLGSLVNVYKDGSVRIAHGACEIGQGVHTKVAQMAAYTLSALLPGTQQLPLSTFFFSDTDTHTVPFMSATGGSSTSESACQAVALACQKLVSRLQPVVAMLTAKAAEEAGEGEEPKPVTWASIAATAQGKGIDLSAQASLHVRNPVPPPAAAAAEGEAKEAESKEIEVDNSHPLAGDLYHTDGERALRHYFNWGVCCSEVEVDVLTGETTVLRSDIIYDCGKSLNPAVDIGQAEGGFIMGVGFFLQERLLVDPSTGLLLSDGTWEYKPPTALDVPLTLNIALLQDSPWNKGVLSSKASGEPPLVLSASVFLAVKQAIAAARADQQLSACFRLNAPATPEVVAAACGFPSPTLPAAPPAAAGEKTADDA